ncbi:hypothetical protein [Candidatus Bealeia paramacronuclearis]|uniref:hypothetical protein n=1 Tax=Candidatus Bealeia paramacronuclearis TaxID=1921001 RepID=UPI0030D382D9
MEDVLVYPNGTGEDVVDTFSQSILFLQEFGLIKSGYDVEVPEYNVTKGNAMTDESVNYDIQQVQQHI